MSKKTPLYDLHLKSNATIVDFSGWQMPLHYGSQIAEHHAVRKNVGLFDVSHMGVIDISGPDSIAYLRYILANDVAKLKNGSALYSCMLNEQGGVVDDLIVYQFSEEQFRLVVNAGCREKDLLWLEREANQFDVKLTFREDLCLLALQGPKAIQHLTFIYAKQVSEKINALKPFQFLMFPKDTLIARTGYTGESGVEMILPKDQALLVWEKALKHHIQPCGLGARDTLRLEAGLNLYGADMTEDTSPFVSNLGWTVSFQDEKRNFIGKDALLAEKSQGVSQKMVGLILESRGVLRNHQKVKVTDDELGEITSGTFSPTLNKSIALARIPISNAETALVERKGDWLEVKIVKPKFL